MVYFDKVKDKIEAYSKMPLKQKQALPFLQLVDLEPGKKTFDEMMLEMLE